MHFFLQQQSSQSFDIWHSNALKILSEASNFCWLNWVHVTRKTCLVWVGRRLEKGNGITFREVWNECVTLLWLKNSFNFDSKVLKARDSFCVQQLLFSHEIDIQGSTYSIWRKSALLKRLGAHVHLFWKSIKINLTTVSASNTITWELWQRNRFTRPFWTRTWLNCQTNNQLERDKHSLISAWH